MRFVTSSIVTASSKHHPCIQKLRRKNIRSVGHHPGVSVPRVSSARRFFVAHPFVDDRPSVVAPQSLSASASGNKRHPACAFLGLDGVGIVPGLYVAAGIGWTKVCQDGEGLAHTLDERGLVQKL